jgi:putative phosphoesterase
MRIAVVSDVHGNLTALDAVTRDLRLTAPDIVVNGGDLVGSGSSPAEVIDRVRALGWPGVLGNTDEMLWRPERVEQTLSAPHYARLKNHILTHVIPVTRDAIGDERLAWLKALPCNWSQDDTSVVHAGPDDPWRSPGVSAPDDELERVYSPLGTPRVVYGHIHHPFVRPLGRLTVANSGSVSLSYDGDPRASYAILDDGRIDIRRVAYDVEEEVARLRATRDPHAEWLAQMLRAGAFVPLPD